MKEFVNYYFKVPHDGPMLISGLPLPCPVKGPYKFINCDFHSGLREELEKNYKDSEFIDCNRR